MLLPIVRRNIRPHDANCRSWKGSFASDLPATSEFHSLMGTIFAAPYGLCFSCLARFRFPVKCRLVPLRWCACIHTGEFDEVPGPRLWRYSAGRHFHSTLKLQFNPNIVNGTGPRVWKSTCFFDSFARRNLLRDQDLAHDVVLDFLSSVRVILQYPVTYMAVWYYSRSRARDGYLVDSGNDGTHTSPMNIVTLSLV